MSEREKAEEAVARVIAEAIKAARELYPEGSPDAIEAMSRLLLLRGAAVMKDQKAA